MVFPCCWGSWCPYVLLVQTLIVQSTKRVNRRISLHWQRRFFSALLLILQMHVPCEPNGLSTGIRNITTNVLTFCATFSSSNHPPLLLYCSASNLHFLQMEIDLAGQIVLLDEAHNIEDCARESSSYTLDHQSLLMCRQELDNMVKKNIKPLDHERLMGFCYSLIKLVV